jgi:hypothetical protein
MPSLNITRKKKLETIPADPACLNAEDEVQTDGKAFPFLPLKTKESLPLFAVDDPKKTFLCRSCLKKKWSTNRRAGPTYFAFDDPKKTFLFCR